MFPLLHSVLPSSMCSQITHSKFSGINGQNQQQSESCSVALCGKWCIHDLGVSQKCQTKPRWAVFKIPFLFHWILVGWERDSPIGLWNNPQYIKGSIIPQLIIHQPGFWTPQVRWRIPVPPQSPHQKSQTRWDPRCQPATGSRAVTWGNDETPNKTLSDLALWRASIVMGLQMDGLWGKILFQWMILGIPPFMETT